MNIDVIVKFDLHETVARERFNYALRRRNDVENNVAVWK